MPRKPKKTEPKIVTASSIDRKRRVSTAPDGLYDPANPGHRWERPLQAPGRMQVDFEERVDFRRLHEYRLARTRNATASSSIVSTCSAAASAIESGYFFDSSSDGSARTGTCPGGACATASSSVCSQRHSLAGRTRPSGPTWSRPQ